MREVRCVVVTAGPTFIDRFTPTEFPRGSLLERSLTIPGLSFRSQARLGFFLRDARPNCRTVKNTLSLTTLDMLILGEKGLGKDSGGCAALQPSSSAATTQTVVGHRGAP